MQNFDVQLNLLLVNKALLVVLTMSVTNVRASEPCEPCEPRGEPCEKRAMLVMAASHASHDCESACESHSY